MIDYIALYLPQFQPNNDNDRWYGKGFTEWTNVAKAKPLYRGHYQPHIPADLGFYDLRVRETRLAQAEMAKQYGVAAFCYWTYWFGDGKQLLEKTIWEVYSDREITLPFCLAWANHSWEKKQWNKNGSNELLVEQKYLGEKDYTDFFYNYLPIFKDERYYRVDGKLFFIIYSPLESNEISKFISTWRILAKKENIGDFYFVGKDMSGENVERIKSVGCDAVFDDNTLNIHHELSMATKIRLFIERKYLKKPTVFKYKEAINYMITQSETRDDVIPVVAPNWDHSPRSGRNGLILDSCEPKYFYKLLQKAIKCVEKKDPGHRQVIIKSWNEWGEGNHMEPDLKYGLGYLEALRKSLEGKD